MKTIGVLALAAATLVAATPVSTAAAKDGVCVVADPSGTPLNVRIEPNGPIIGTLSNGDWVRIRAIRTDAGRRWAHVYGANRFGEVGDPLGWVYLNYLNCR